MPGCAIQEPKGMGLQRAVPGGVVPESPSRLTSRVETADFSRSYLMLKPKYASLACVHPLVLTAVTGIDFRNAIPR